MAETNTPAFVPPMNKITDSDPSIVRIPLDVVDIGFRKSQQSGLMSNNDMTIRHVKNGG
jgi:hypothetical protein